MTDTIAVYFGCWDEPGHYLWKPDKQRVLFRYIDSAIPTADILDGSRLFLPRPEKKGSGCVTYLPAPNLSILAWWGSPWDTRGAVNAAFITKGDVGETVAWQLFCRYFPDLSAQIERPTTDHDGESTSG